MSTKTAKKYEDALGTGDGTAVGDGTVEAVVDHQSQTISLRGDISMLIDAWRDSDEPREEPEYVVMTIPMEVGAHERS